MPPDILWHIQLLCTRQSNWLESTWALSKTSVGLGSQKSLRAPASVPWHYCGGKPHSDGSCGQESGAQSSCCFLNASIRLCRHNQVSSIPVSALRCQFLSDTGNPEYISKKMGRVIWLTIVLVLAHRFKTHLHSYLLFTLQTAKQRWWQPLKEEGPCTEMFTYLPPKVFTLLVKGPDCLSSVWVSLNLICPYSFCIALGWKGLAL